ncbi:MAG: RidA family protein, partial [Candidatus Binatia bacterium]
MEIEKKLEEMGLQLPNPPVPAANYIGYVRVGNLLFIGGNIGRINGVLKYRGKVGAGVTREQAYDAARNCALNHLAIMKAALGDLDRVE